MGTKLPEHLQPTAHWFPLQAALGPALCTQCPLHSSECRCETPSTAKGQVHRALRSPDWRGAPSPCGREEAPDTPTDNRAWAPKLPPQEYRGLLGCCRAHTHNPHGQGTGRGSRPGAHAHFDLSPCPSPWVMCLTQFTEGISQPRLLAPLPPCPSPAL